MTRSTALAAGALALGLLGLAGWKLSSRTAGAAAPASASATPLPAQAALQLQDSDLVTLRRAELVDAVALTGSLKAAVSALVKARSAGELLELGPREGDTVRAGQIVGRIDPADAQLRLRQAEQQIESAQAQLDIAGRTLDNNRALVEQGFISPTALETSVSNHRAAQAALQSARASADLARRALDDTVLKAPISGQVAQRLAQPGERVALEARLLEIIDLDRLELEATVPAAELARTRIGAGAVLQVEGVDTPVRARVLRISPAAQAGTRSVPVHLAIEPAPGLRAGLFARVKEGYWFCVRLATCVLVVLAVLLWVFAPQLVEIFRSDPAVVAVGVAALHIQCCTVILNGFNMMGNMMTQTMGRTGIASFLALCRQGLFLAPIVLILPMMFGVLGVEMAQSVSDVLTFVVTIPFMRRILHELR